VEKTQRISQSACGKNTQGISKSDLWKEYSRD